MTTHGDKTDSDDPSVSYNIEDDKSDTDSDIISIAHNTEDMESEQDHPEDGDEIKTLLDDITSIENASKQVHSCMEGIMKAKKHYLEMEKEAYDKLDDIRKELTSLEEEREKREEQTSLSLEYVTAVYERIEKLSLCTHGISNILLPVMKCGDEATITIEEERKKMMQGADTIRAREKEAYDKLDDIRSELTCLILNILLPVMKCGEEATIAMEEERKKLMQGTDTIHSRIVPCIQKYNKSIKKLKQEVKQRHKEQIEKVQESNLNKYNENIENVKTDIRQYYDTEIEKAQAINAELSSRLKKVNDSLVPKLEKDCKEALKEVDDKAKQHYHGTIQELEKFDTTVEEIQRSTERCTKQSSGERIHQMKQEIQDLRLTVDELKKENEMLNATVDEKINENLRLDTELQTLIKEKERITVNKTVTALQTENDELRKELIDKHVLIDQAHKTLSRSKSLCDLSYSKEEMKIRSKMLKRMRRENNQQQQQISKDHAETLYECTGKAKSLQSLTQKFKNDYRLQKDETGMFDSDEDLTEREMTAQDILKSLSKDSKTTTTVQNNYNIITSNATFQKDCLVEAITATANSDRSITDS